MIPKTEDQKNSSSPQSRVPSPQNLLLSQDGFFSRPRENSSSSSQDESAPAPSPTSSTASVRSSDHGLAEFKTVAESMKQEIEYIKGLCANLTIENSRELIKMVLDFKFSEHPMHQVIKDFLPVIKDKSDEFYMKYRAPGYDKLADMHYRFGEYLSSIVHLCKKAIMEIEKKYAESIAETPDEQKKNLEIFFEILKTKLTWGLRDEANKLFSEALLYSRVALMLHQSDLLSYDGYASETRLTEGGLKKWVDFLESKLCSELSKYVVGHEKRVEIELKKAQAIYVHSEHQQQVL